MLFSLASNSKRIAVILATDRLFDLQDERLLTKGELREFCFILFGSEVFDSALEAEAD